MRNPLDVDQQTPSDTAYIIEQKNQIIQQHGGSVCRITFDKTSVMSMDTFIQTEVPVIKENMQKDKSLYILRDTANRNVTLMYDDCVVKYDCCGVEEVPLAGLTKHLIVKEMKKFFPGINYPLVGFVETPSKTVITVYLAPKTFVYKSTSFNGGQFEARITAPPLWFRVSLSNAKTLLGCGIAVVLQSELNPMDTRLHSWVLPNVHTSGEVCLGSTRVADTGINAEEITYGVCVQSAIDQVFNSMWNLDLIWDTDYQQVLGKAYEQLPKKEEYERRLSLNRGSKDACSVLRVLRVLSEPTGYLLLDWPLLGRSSNTKAEDFLTWGC